MAAVDNLFSAFKAQIPTMFVHRHGDVNIARYETKVQLHNDREDPLYVRSDKSIPKDSKMYYFEVKLDTKANQNSLNDSVIIGFSNENTNYQTQKMGYYKDTYGYQCDGTFIFGQKGTNILPDNAIKYVNVCRNKCKKLPTYGNNRIIDRICSCHVSS
jgi:hypothetical protein